MPVLDWPVIVRLPGSLPKKVLLAKLCRKMTPPLRRLPAVAVEFTMVKLAGTSLGPGGPCGPGERAKATAVRGNRADKTLCPPWRTTKYPEEPEVYYSVLQPRAT